MLLLLTGPIKEVTENKKIGSNALQHQIMRPHFCIGNNDDKKTLLNEKK